MIYGSPEARIWPSWCLTQNSHALRRSATSSLGRLAWTRFKSASKRWHTELGSMEEPAGSRTARGESPLGAESALGTSSGTGCRTVAISHYRPLPLQSDRKRCHCPQRAPIREGCLHEG